MPIKFERINDNLFVTHLSSPDEAASDMKMSDEAASDMKMSDNDTTKR